MSRTADEGGFCPYCDRTVTARQDAGFALQESRTRFAPAMLLQPLMTQRISVWEKSSPLKERLSADLGEGIGGAVAIVQPSPMPPVAIPAVGDSCDFGLVDIDADKVNGGAM